MDFLRSHSPKKQLKKQLKKRILTASLLLGCGVTAYALLVRLELAMPPSQIPAVLCLPDCQKEQSVHLKATRATSSESVDTTDYLNSSQKLQELLEDNFDKEKVSLLVEKSSYRLTIFYQGEPVKAYPTVFGTAPVGDKFAEGDRKTPEGIYRVRDLYDHPEWSKFIWLDYPTPQDWQEHAQAKLAGDIPPQATIGSEVGIHGVPAGADSLIDQKTNWTWGCVSLKNQDVDEIYTVIRAGTLVEIVP